MNMKITRATPTLEFNIQMRHHIYILVSPTFADLASYELAKVI